MNSENSITQPILHPIIQQFIPRVFENNSGQGDNLSINFDCLIDLEPEIIALVFKQIRHNFNLKQLELKLSARMDLDVQYQYVTELLTHFPAMEALSLTYPDARDNDEAINLNHLMAVAPYLSCLESFKISSKGNWEDTALFEQIGPFISTLANKRNLKSLHTYIPDFPGDCSILFHALSDCSSLEEFSYMNSNFAEYDDFCEFIRTNQTIRTLTLDLDTAVASVDFVNPLLSNQSLSKLDINVYKNAEVIEPYKDSDELNQWAVSISNNTTLKHLRLNIELDLLKFDKTTFGVANLLESIARNQTLLSVDLNFGTHVAEYFGENWPELSQTLLQTFEKNYSLLDCKIEPELDSHIQPFLRRNQQARQIILTSLPTLSTHYHVSNPNRYNEFERKILTGEQITSDNTMSYQGLNYILLNLIASKDQDHSLKLTFGAKLSRYLDFMVMQLMSQRAQSSPLNQNVSGIIGEFLGYDELGKISALTGGFFLRAKKDVPLQMPEQLSIATNLGKRSRDSDTEDCGCYSSYLK